MPDLINGKRETCNILIAEKLIVKSGIFNPSLDKRWTLEALEISIIRFKSQGFFSLQRTEIE